jgi:hypothetical protein
MYAGLGVLAVAFFSWQVPETKGRSLEEIERDVHGGRSGGERHRGVGGHKPAHP